MNTSINGLLSHALFLMLICSNSTAAVVVHTTDFISDSQRTGFNGFEGMPDGALNAPYWEHDSITVEQVNGQGDEIWTTCSQCGIEGLRSWYPNGGDNGYTQITRSSLVDFESVGFLIGQGGSPGFFQYELLNDGSSVMQGAFESTYVGWEDNTLLYLGFSGGGFDTILVRHVAGNPQLFFDSPSYNDLSLDSIEISNIPLPPSILLFLSGLLPFALTRQKKD